MKPAKEGRDVPTRWPRRAVLRAIVWLAGSAPLLLTACGVGPASSATAATGGAAAGPTASQPAAAATSTVGPGPTGVGAASPVAAPTAASVAFAAATAPASTPPAPAQASTATARPATAASGTCVLSPEMTEGPYYIDENLNRSDITEGKPGVPLQLRLTVQNASTCQPIAGATVDVWHCDASGVYSGYAAAQGPGGGPGGPGGPPPSGNPPQGGPPPGGGPGAAGGGHAQPTNNETFLRGNQQTDASGLATFKTIYRAGTPAGRPTSTSRSTSAATWSTPASSSSTTR